MSVECSDPFEGWSLQEALERTADPAFWDAWIAAKTAYEKIRAPIPSAPGSFITPDPAFVKSKQRAALLAFDELKHAFVELLADERLIATGSATHRSTAPAAIHCDAWKKLRLDFENSTVKEPGEAGLKIYNIRVFPFIHAPEAAIRLNGLSLVQAFRKSVLNDPEIAALRRRIADQKHRDTMFTEGQMPGLMIDYRWPLDLTSKELAFQFTRPPLLYAGQILPPIPSPVRQTCDVIVDRLQRLRRHLIDGDLVARGTFVRMGLPQYIDPLQWSRAGLFIDVKNGDLLEGQYQTPAVQWSGISLQHRSSTVHALPPIAALAPQILTAPSGNEFHVKPIAHDPASSAAAESRSSLSKTSERAAQSMKAEALCLTWLSEVFGASPNLRTRSNESLWQEAKTRWPNLSERAFQRLRAQAINDTMASAWKAGGAPRKPPQHNLRSKP